MKGAALPIVLGGVSLPADVWTSQLTLPAVGPKDSGLGGNVVALPFTSTSALCLIIQHGEQEVGAARSTP